MVGFKTVRFNTDSYSYVDILIVISHVGVRLITEDQGLSTLYVIIENGFSHRQGIACILAITLIAKAFHISWQSYLISLAGVFERELEWAIDNIIKSTCIERAPMIFRFHSRLGICNVIYSFF